MPTVPRFTFHILFVCLLALGVVVGLANRSQVKNSKDPRRSINDFNRWMQPGPAMDAGSVPEFIHAHADYVNDDFPNPPIVIALFAPFTLLSPANAQLAWALCKPFMLLAIFWLCVRMLKNAGQRVELPALALVFLVWLWPVHSDLAAGQSNLLMLLPLAGALLLFQSQSRPLDIWGGILLALAISVKVTPVIFLPYLLLQRRWMAAVWTVLGLGIWLILVPGVLFGLAQNLTWLIEWAGIMLLPYVSHNTVVYANNQSLPSFLARLLEHTPAFSTMNKQRTVSTDHYVNLLNLSPAVVGWITRGLLGLMALAGAFWMRKKLATFRGQAYLLHISLLAIFMLLASERTWHHHAVTLIFPLLAIAAIHGDKPGAQWLRNLALGALVFAAVCFPLSTDAAKFLGQFGPLEMRALGVYLIPMLLLMVPLLMARRKISSQEARFLSEAPKTG